MVNIQLIDKTTISECFICAIEYNDYSGLSDEEENQLDAWIADYPNCIFVCSYIDGFAKCEITGLMGNCVNVKIYRNQL